MIKSYFFTKRNVFNGLFSAALKHENDGELPEAIEDYENALKEANKTRYNHHMKGRIKAKVKLLHSIIDYHNNLRFRHPKSTV